MPEAFHLWREYAMKPYQRWACDIVEDLATDDGYRIADYEPGVADGMFLHRMHEHLMRPHPVNQVIADDERIVDMPIVAQPKEPGHLAEAVRTVPGAVLSSQGRP